MKELLLNILPTVLGKKGHPIQCSPITKQGRFSLSDAKACQECKRKYPVRITCDEDVLKIFTDTAIEIFNFELFISQWDDTPNRVIRRCDYLMWDDAIDGRKVAFCDLTCSIPEHVAPNPHDKHPEGKRLYAYGQMKDSLDVLLAINVLDQYLLTATKKVFLFGWREPEIRVDTDDTAEQAMSNFITRTAIYTVSTFTQPATHHGFDFVQVKYPATYQW